MYSIILFITSLFVYLRTLVPTVYVGDSGELITGAAILGIAHPPGYPLYCILGKVFSILIPFGNSAFKITFMSAFFSALAVVLLFHIALKIFLAIDEKFARIAAFCSAILFAFSSTLWSQSVEAEVYTLNIFMLALTLYIFINWQKNYNTKFLYLLSLICGISICNHHTMMLMTLFYLICMLFLYRGIPLKQWIFIIGVFFIGLTFYFYIPIRSLANPMLDWGNPDNFDKFINHIIRRQFGGLEKTPRTLGLFLIQLQEYFKLLLNEFTIYPFLFFMPGIILLYKFCRKILILTIGIFCLITLGVLLVINFPITPKELYLAKVFFIPCYFVFAIWIGAGLLWLISKVKYFVIVCILILPLPLIANYFEKDISRNFSAYDNANNVLKSVSDNSILFTAGDNLTFPLGYITLVEKTYPQVTIYDRMGNVFKYIYGEEWLDSYQRQLRRVQIESKIILTADKPIYYGVMGAKIALEFPIETLGLVYKVKNAPQEHPEFAMVNEVSQSNNEEKIWEKYIVRGIDDSSIYKDFMVRDVTSQYYLCFGEYLFKKGEDNKAKKMFVVASDVGSDIEVLHLRLGNSYESRNMFDEAVLEFKKTIAINPTFADGFVNLGTSYGKQGKYDDAVREFKRALMVNPFSAEAHNNLCIAYMKLDKLDDALSECEINIKYNPNYAEAYSNLGIIYATRGDMKNAIFYWEKVLVINPNHRGAIENMRRAQSILGTANSP